MSWWQILIIVLVGVLMLISWIGIVWHGEKETQTKYDENKNKIDKLEFEVNELYRNNGKLFNRIQELEKRETEVHELTTFEPENDGLTTVKLIKVVFNGLLNDEAKEEKIKQIKKYINEYGIIPEDNSYEIIPIEFMKVNHVKTVKVEFVDTAKK